MLSRPEPDKVYLLLIIYINYILSISSCILSLLLFLLL